MPVLTLAEFEPLLALIVTRLRAALRVSFERTVKSNGRLIHAA